MDRTLALPNYKLISGVIRDRRPISHAHATLSYSVFTNTTSPTCLRVS